MKAQYQTRQLSELEAFLKSMTGRHITVGQIQGYFKEKEISIGTATIYRHLERMIEEGSVVKYNMDMESGASFEYIGENGSEHSPFCFHLKCEKCGKLVHLECNKLAQMNRHMMEEHGFHVDSLKTVFYGICRECREQFLQKQ